MTVDAVRIFFDDYVDAFSRRDVNAVARLWDYPATISAPSGSAAFDEQGFRKNTEALCRFYDRQGMAEVRKRLADFHELSPTVGSATTEDEMYDRDGALIAAWRHVYVLREAGDGIRAVFAVADGEVEAWAARGTPLGNG